MKKTTNPKPHMKRREMRSHIVPNSEVVAYANVTSIMLSQTILRIDRIRIDGVLKDVDNQATQGLSNRGIHPQPIKRPDIAGPQFFDAARSYEFGIKAL